MSLASEFHDKCAIVACTCFSYAQAWAFLRGPRFKIILTLTSSSACSDLGLWFWYLLVDHLLKLVSAIFYQIFIFYHMIALQKLWRMLFISSKKPFLFEIFLFLYFHLPVFFSLPTIALEVDPTKILVYGIINCLNKNLITHFIWYLKKEIRYDIETLSIYRVLNKEHFHEKIIQKICTKS